MDYVTYCPPGQEDQLGPQGVIQPEGDSSPTTSDISREPSPAPPKDKKSADAALSDDSYFNSNLKGSGDEEKGERRIVYDRKKSFSTLVMHKMLHTDGTQLELVLVVLERNDDAKKIFTKNTLSDMCGLSGITTEVLYKRGGPSQCHH
ncbi:hypothetical protein EVAR_60012_1 [Eumeta japonica]|uniref:Uncharacterized protein n=1 Tax=Eumeta variegata TaxID=151549 RepID=A0A4C1ZN21_EUMVA|nr:hypothetical protein EVAR_60012_1 [Eumeta japonica]